MKFTLPGIEDRTLVVGRTGSGKTFAGLWLLSEMPVDEMPWVIIDYKRESKIAAIPHAQFIDFNTIPQAPGVYIIQPLQNQHDEVTAYLEEIWRRENIGVFIDEGVMLARNDALDTILIQGRSKHIPVIMLSQRPVGISRFAFSESQYFMIFPNHDKRERKTVSEFTTLFQEPELMEHTLPRYHSWWFDVSEQQKIPLKPVPSLDKIYATFERKLKPVEEFEPPPPEPLGWLSWFRRVSSRSSIQKI